MFSLRLSLFILTLSALVSGRSPSCNGSPLLCDRPYTNVSFIGTHNSAFAGVHPSDNQNVGIIGQLDAGIRFLQAQVHLVDPENPSSALHMCHASCYIRDAGPLTDYLMTLKIWLNAHPHEVVTLLLVNGNRSPALRYGHAFDAVGLRRYAYTPELDPLPIAAWPTLGQMIARGDRLVVMLDNGADTTVVPYILNQYSYYFENPFAITDPRDFDQCVVSRPNGSTGRGRMMLMNHFLGVDLFGIRVPDRLAAPKTNAADGPGSLGAQAALCGELHGHWPQVAMVDWFDQGDVFAVQERMNGFSSHRDEENGMIVQQ